LLPIAALIQAHERLAADVRGARAHHLAYDLVPALGAKVGEHLEQRPSRQVVPMGELEKHGLAASMTRSSPRSTTIDPGRLHEDLEERRPLVDQGVPGAHEREL